MAPTNRAASRGAFLKKVTKYAMPSDDDLRALWARYDFNGNGMLSLAEIDKIVVERFPEFDDKPALMRAYKFADADGSGCIGRSEFGLLLRSLVYFHELWENFERADGDGDRRIDFDEFVAGAPIIGLDLTRKTARELFDAMDSDGGGLVLFDEFCSYMGRLRAEQLADAGRDAPGWIFAESLSRRGDSGYVPTAYLEFQADFRRHAEEAAPPDAGPE